MGKKLASLLSSLVGGEKETIPSYVYDLPLCDKSRKVIIFRVYGIDKISTDVKYMSVEGVLHLFNGIKEVDIQRPTDEIDILVGLEICRISSSTRTICRPFDHPE